MLLCIGLNHKTAPIDMREKLAIAESDVPEALKLLRDDYDIDESALLSTCNRVELYCAVDGTEKNRVVRSLKVFFGKYSGTKPAFYKKHLYVYEDGDTIRHLFRVGAGLDSMVIGETQILGQVKQCLKLARENDSCGVLLNQLFQKAISVGKRVRSESEISRSLSSVPQAAVRFAEKINGKLTGKRIAIVGSGKISKLTARKFIEATQSNITIVNRSYNKAVDFAKEIGALARKLDEALTFLDDCDIVVSSTTSPEFVINLSQMKQAMGRRKDRPITLIDIAVPRDIDPEIAALEHVRLFNIDDLQGILDSVDKNREKEIDKIQQMIDIESEKFTAKLSMNAINPTIRLLKDRLEELRIGEEKRLFKDFDGFDEKQIEKIRHFGKALINKISHVPIKRLKENPNEHESIAKLLEDFFDL